MRRFVGPCVIGFVVVIWACGGGAEVGKSCTSDAECGTLKCMCAIGPDAGGTGSIPGVCSRSCGSRADCATFGSEARCAKGSLGCNVCLNEYSGPELPVNLQIVKVHDHVAVAVAVKVAAKVNVEDNVNVDFDFDVDGVVILDGNGNVIGIVDALM